MNFFLAILAGAIQGLTEFLPISSTGHLIIFETIFKIPQSTFGLAFDASLHLGTLLAVVVFFFKDYLKIFNPKNKLFIHLVIGTVPAAIFGLLFDDFIESSVRQLWIIGLSMIIFSAVIYYSDKYGKKTGDLNKITNFQSLVIGLFQSIALIPGVSRSGATISGGLIFGLTRKESARFAFMLSGPIIAGAGSKKFYETVVQNQI